jgi:hypothetical protein
VDMLTLYLWLVLTHVASMPHWYPPGDRVDALERSWKLEHAMTGV